MKYTDQIRDRLYEAKRHRPYDEEDRHEQASLAWSAVYQYAPTDLITFIRLVDTLEHQHSPYEAVLRHPTGNGDEGTAVVACAACAHDAPRHLHEPMARRCLAMLHHSNDLQHPRRRSMSTYTIPDDPQCTVWGKDGQEFHYDRERGRYRAADNPDCFPLYWEELLVDYGPITDIDPAPVRVGDVIVGPRHYSTLPHGAVFRHIGAVPGQGEYDLPDEVFNIAVSECYTDGSGGIRYVGSEGFWDEFDNGETWERIY